MKTNPWIKIRPGLYEKTIRPENDPHANQYDTLREAKLIEEEI
jgi:hypothetical protein